MKELNYEKDLSIDKFKLDEEWIRQPSLFMYYADEAAKADSEARSSKEKIEYLKATLYAEYRALKEANGEKVTEALMDSLVKADARYKDAVQENIKNMEKARVLSSAVEAFSQRKSALENLVKMNLAGYYSKPADVKGEGFSQNEKATETGTSRQRGKLNSRRS